MEQRMTELHTFAALELAAEGTDDRWSAEIEAQGTDHLRVRLAADGDDFPRFAIGSRITCTMEDGSEVFSADARVLSQSGTTVWLNVEPLWNRGGRRSRQRVKGGFGVSFEGDSITGIGFCRNISAGGMRVRVGEQLPLDASLRLIFRLPQQSKPITANVRVLYHRAIGPADGHLEAGLKFVEMPMEEAVRIAAFCGSGG